MKELVWLNRDYIWGLRKKSRFTPIWVAEKVRLVRWNWRRGNLGAIGAYIVSKRYQYFLHSGKVPGHEAICAIQDRPFWLKWIRPVGLP